MADNNNSSGGDGASSGGGGGHRRGIVKVAKRQVKAAKADLRKARRTPERGDNAEARAAVSRAKRNVDLATQARRSVRLAKKAVTAAAETPGAADDRAAQRALKAAKKERRQVGKDIRKGLDAGALDTLQKKTLAQQYGYAYDVLKKDPELWDLFRRATAGEAGWTPERFQAKLRETEWFKSRTASERIAWAQEAAGGLDWDKRVAQATEAVQRRAAGLGATLSQDDLATLAHAYIFGGWDDDESAMDDALSTYIGTEAGAAGTVIDELQQTAIANGMRYDDGFYRSVAQRIARGELQAEDVQRQIRAEAASAWPTLSERIMAGEDVADLTSNYRDTMGRVLEIDPAQVDVNDPLLRQAFGQADPNTGQPVAMGLWDFEKALRKDDRWQYTQNARQETMDYGMRVLQMFGFQG